MAGSLDVQSIPNQVEAIYVAYFGRAADGNGQLYWVNQFNVDVNVDHLSVDQAAVMISNSFAVQPEAKAMYAFLNSPPITLNPADPTQIAAADNLITSAYLHLFNRVVPVTDPGVTVLAGSDPRRRRVGRFGALCHRQRRDRRRRGRAGGEDRRRDHVHERHLCGQYRRGRSGHRPANSVLRNRGAELSDPRRGRHHPGRLAGRERRVCRRRLDPDPDADAGGGQYQHRHLGRGVQRAPGYSPDHRGGRDRWWFEHQSSDPHGRGYDVRYEQAMAS